MSNDMVVTAPVSDGTGGGGLYGSYSPGGATGMTSGQAMSMLISTIEQGGGFDKTCQIVAKAANENKFQVLIDNFRQSVFFDNAISGDGYHVYDWFTNNSIRQSFQINDMNDKLSGSVWSIFSAMSNFFWGNGRSMDIDINSIGLNIQTGKIPGFQNELNNYSKPGVYNLSYKFAYDTGQDSTVAGLYLGNVTLQMTGCSGQQKLATALEFSQNNRSDSFGVSPPLY